MKLLNLLRGNDINSGVNEYINTPGALLLDVRTPQEYIAGHIPGSKNVPLQTINNISNVTDDKDIPIFVYCHSGGRSSRATGALQSMGYVNVKNIGGIAAYSGKVEH